MTPSQVIEPHHLPPYISKTTPDDIFSSSDFEEAKQFFEKEFILKKLEENGWDVSKTAEAMGIEESRLLKKIKSYGIEVKE